ncbi:MAG: hypothetical protein MUP14_03845 [Dehalococcoidia bacterium]|nr:hypothetical protein [Dehalococcoidia bacterium]
MRFFRRRRNTENDEEKKELALDTDTEAQALAQDMPEADTPTDGEALVPEGDLLAQIGAETNAEIRAEEGAREAEGGSPQGGDSLDPDLLDIFRAAKDEVHESTLASELEDIPAQDLLSDLVGISHDLRTMPRTHAEPDQDRK